MKIYLVRWYSLSIKLSTICSTCRQYSRCQVVLKAIRSRENRRNILSQMLWMLKKRFLEMWTRLSNLISTFWTKSCLKKLTNFWPYSLWRSEAEMMIACGCHGDKIAANMIESFVRSFLVSSASDARGCSCAVVLLSITSNICVTMKRKITGI